MVSSKPNDDARSETASRIETPSGEEDAAQLSNEQRHANVHRLRRTAFQHEDGEVGNGNLTLEENRSHFALWAALKSPLIIGTPLDGIKPEILEILSNRELIAFNQDPIFGAPAKPYKWGVNPNFSWNQTHPAEYWSGQSSRGTHVFALNTLDDAATKTIVFAEVPGLDTDTEYVVYDSSTGKEQGSFTGAHQAVVERHDTMAIRVVKADGMSFNSAHDELWAPANPTT